MDYTPIIVALITGGLALIGVMITNANSNTKIEHKLETAQAVTDTKLEQLAEEIHKSNSYAERIPILEEQMKVANHRIDDLEDIAKNKWV